jgi:amino acid transporter
VTAFEARYSRDLGWPSRFIAYAVFALYFLCTIGEALNVKWTDSRLAKRATDQSLPHSYNVVINTVWDAGHYKLAGFLNGCMIFSVLSASNTSLYVASRTLYGLAVNVPKTNTIGRQLHKTGHVMDNGIPPWSIVLSALSFLWLPFAVTKGGDTISNVGACCRSLSSD